jgi:hypothetical protein
MGQIIGLETLLGTCRAVRIVWFGGRFGGGKSMIAFEVARQLALRDRSLTVFSNTHCAFSEREPPEPFQHVVAVIDEGGIFFSTRGSADTMLAALRKLNLIMLLPSVQPPTARLRTATCFRIFDGYSMGFPVWVYKLSTNTQGIKDESTIIWWRPLQHIGAYSTKHMPVDDCGIGEAIEKQLPALKNKKRRESDEDAAIAGMTAALDDMISTGVQVQYDKRKRVR